MNHLQIATITLILAGLAGLAYAPVLAAMLAVVGLLLLDLVMIGGLVRLFALMRRG